MKYKSANDIPASNSIRKLNPTLFLNYSGEVAELECNSGNAALAKTQTKVPNTERFLVRVTAVRKRLVDEDNLCEKYHVDCCRYAGIIPSDSPDKARIEVRQIKAVGKEPETITIEVFNILTEQIKP